MTQIGNIIQWGGQYGDLTYSPGHLLVNAVMERLFENKPSFTLSQSYKCGAEPIWENMGTVILLQRNDAQISTFLKAKDGQFVNATYYSNSHSFSVLVASFTSEEDAAAVLASIVKQLPKIELAPDNTIAVRFWTLRPDGAASARDRQLDVMTWESVEGNYTSQVQAGLEILHEWTDGPAGGHLLLMHGPAGTGKTNTIRTLAHNWKEWCETHYVVDPENFFGNAHYMTSILLGEEVTTEKWRLIVIEDADELLTADAKQRSGHAMGRLLNICDGLIGQGLKVMVLITTNEPVGKMHPAILRPGRCVANIPFGKLNSDEADLWRKHRELTTTGKSATLAELFHEWHNNQVSVTEPTKQIGFSR